MDYNDMLSFLQGLLSNKQATNTSQYGTNLDFLKQQLGQQDTQFNKNLALQQAAQNIANQQFADTLGFQKQQFGDTLGFQKQQFNDTLAQQKANDLWNHMMSQNQFNAQQNQQATQNFLSDPVAQAVRAKVNKVDTVNPQLKATWGITPGTETRFISLGV